VGITSSQLRSALDRLNTLANQQMETQSADAFFLGLLSSSYYNFNETQIARRYADYMAEQQTEDGSIR
jgi:hypothetical protein